MSFVDNPNQTYNEDFATDTGHVYNSILAQFSGGRIEQIDQFANVTFAAYYDVTSSPDANYGAGVLTGTLAGSPLPTIGGGYLKFIDVVGQQCDYDATLNADEQQIITVRTVLHGQYSGSPATDQVFWTICRADGDARNLLSLSHLSTGIIRVEVSNVSGTTFNTDLPVWSPVINGDYVLELNCDFTTGRQRLFIDGVQHGVTMTHQLIRSSQIDLLRIGAGAAGSGCPYFQLNSIMIFSTIQHETDHTPCSGSECEPTTVYVETTDIIPDNTYVDDGAIQSYTAFDAIDNGATYIINGKYYNIVSGAWETSTSNSQSNTKAEVDTYISSLTAEETTTVKLVLASSDTEINYCADLTITYTGQLFQKIVSLEKVKAYLKIDADDTEYDAQLDDMIDSATQELYSYCYREFDRDTYTEYYDGTGENELWIANPPINSTNSTISVYVDSARTYGTDTQIASSEIILYPEGGKIALDTLYFTRGRRTVKVVYDGGYQSLPDDIALVLLELIAYYWKRKDIGNHGLSSITKQAENVTFEDEETALKNIIDARIAPYVRYVRG